MVRRILYGRAGCSWSVLKKGINTHVYIYIYVYTHTYTYRCIHICVYAYVYLFIHIYGYMWSVGIGFHGATHLMVALWSRASLSLSLSLCMYLRMCLCMYVCMHACMYACMYVCMYVRVCACVPKSSSLVGSQCPLTRFAPGAHSVFLASPCLETGGRHSTQLSLRGIAWFGHGGGDGG